MSKIGLPHKIDFGMCPNSAIHKLEWILCANELTSQRLGILFFFFQGLQYPSFSEGICISSVYTKRQFVCCRCFLTGWFYSWSMRWTHLLSRGSYFNSRVPLPDTHRSLSTATILWWECCGLGPTDFLWSQTDLCFRQNAGSGVSSSMQSPRDKCADKFSSASLKGVPANECSPRQEAQQGLTKMILWTALYNGRLGGNKVKREKRKSEYIPEMVFEDYGESKYIPEMFLED